MKRSQSLVCVIAMAGLAHSAYAQPEAGCGICSWASLKYVFSSEWELAVTLNGYTLNESSASATAWANAFWDMGVSECPEICTTYKVFDFDSDSDSATCTGGPCVSVSVGATAGDLGYPWHGASSTASVSGGPLVASGSKMDQFYVRQEVRGQVGLLPWGCADMSYGNFAHGMASGAATIVRNLDVERTSGPQIMLTLQQSNFSIEIIADGEEPGGCGSAYPPYNQGNPAGYRSIFISTLRVVSVDEYADVHNDVLRGVLATDGAGDLHAMGMFTDPSFSSLDPDYLVENGDTGAIPINFGSDDLVSIEATLDFDAYETSIGNINADRWGADCLHEERVCWDDRELLLSLMGLGFNDWGYEPRADLNLDGTIDVDDLLLFNQVCGSANVDNGTPAIENADFFAFLTLFSSTDPTADIDGSGTVTNDDYFDYLAMYAAQVGCLTCP